MSTIMRPRPTGPGQAIPAPMLLRRGLAAGCAGGLAMSGFLLLVGESSIRRAIDLESGTGDGHHHEEVFSRDVQVFGGLVACLLYGVLLGGVFAVAHALVRRRGGGTPFRSSLQLGAAGFVTVSVLPALKYPADLPGVAAAEDLDQRTVRYLTFLAIGVLLTMLARQLWYHLRDRGLAEEPGTVAVAAFWLASVGTACLIWPQNTTVSGLPAQLVWDFRVSSLGGSLALWTTMALVFGWSAARAPARG